MIEKLKSFYHQLKDGKPGRRFIDFYDEHHRETRKSKWKKAVYPLIGSLSIVAGAILSIPPGVPGFLLVIFGFGIIALDSRHLARLLDFGERKVRRLVDLV